MKIGEIEQRLKRANVHPEVRLIFKLQQEDIAALKQANTGLAQLIDSLIDNNITLLGMIHSMAGTPEVSAHLMAARADAGKANKLVKASRGDDSIVKSEDYLDGDD